MRRLPFLGCAALLIVAGLMLRLVPWGLPLRVHHVGGGVLWGAMVYLLVMALRPRGWDRLAAVMTASIVATTIELFRLYHSPSLDVFRTTLAGQLLLGHIFSGWNILVDMLGILAAALVTWRLGRLDGRPPPPAHGAHSLPRKASS